MLSNIKYKKDIWVIGVLAALFVYVSLGLAPFDAESYSPRGEPVHVKHFGSSADLPYQP